VAIGGGGPGGAKVEIRRQLISHPYGHRLAKTPNHDAYRCHHGDGRRERANEHRSPSQRPARLREASSASTPNILPSIFDEILKSASTTAGIANAEAATSKIAAR